MRLTLTCVALLAALSACSAIAPSASDEEIAAVAFRNDGPASVTLMTVINTSSGSGAHSALLIDGPQRVIFDPAGTTKATDVIAEFYEHVISLVSDNPQEGRGGRKNEGREKENARSAFFLHGAL